MAEKKRQMKLAAHIHPTGHHVAAWLHPRSQKDAGSNAKHYMQVAQIAERGKFDLMFLADAPATRFGSLKGLSRWPQYMAYFEPITILSAMAAVTEHVGFVATASTSYMEPYNLARLFGSLDHISEGRAGWNVVTTANVSAALNYGREEHYSHAERYARAKEVVDVVKGLWDSYDDDAFVRDRETGIYFDPTKLHHLNHKGDYLSVKGPLVMERPPQGHPLIVQAGVSEPGRDLASQIADMVFVQEQRLDRIQQIYKDIKERVAKFGRSPDHCLIMPGMAVQVCKTEDEAKRTHEWLQSSIHPDVGRELLSAEMNYADLSDVDVDKPLPQHLIPTANTTQGNRIRALLAEGPMTVRDMYERFSGARSSHLLVGDPIQVADRLQEWFEARGGDGFIIQPSYLPGGMEDFVDLVIPELQRRGIFRTEYEGKTTRENLGLPRPKSRYAQ